MLGNRKNLLYRAWYGAHKDEVIKHLPRCIAPSVEIGSFFIEDNGTIHAQLRDWVGPLTMARNHELTVLT